MVPSLLLSYLFLKIWSEILRKKKHVGSFLFFAKKSYLFLFEENYGTERDTPTTQTDESSYLHVYASAAAR